MEEISSTVVLPVTDAQMTAFSAWIKNTYVTYDGVMGAIKSPAIDTYIKTHILPIEMNEVLRRSERFRGEKWGDGTIQWLLMNRRRVTAKMTNLKGKIVTMTFPIEAAQARRANRAAATSRRLDRIAADLRYEQERQAYQAAYDIRVATEQAKIYRHTIVTLSDEHALMDADCAICLQNHNMTDACTINCGHQFGSACLAKWKKDTCPLCRTTIKERTVFVAPIVLTDVDVLALTDAVLDAVVDEVLVA